MSEWKERAVRRKDFRNTHDGPEEIPHRKKSKKIRRNRCDHKFSEPVETVSPAWRQDPPKVFPDRTEYIFLSWGYRTQFCTVCKKRKYQSFTRRNFQIRDAKGYLIKEWLTETDSRW